MLRYGFFYGPGTTYAPDGGDRGGDPQAPVPDHRQGQRRVLLHPRGGRRLGHRGRARPRRARASTTWWTTTPRRCASTCRRSPRRWAPSGRCGCPKFVGPPGGRADGRALRHDAPAGVEREGQARARLAAALAELAPGLPRSAGLIGALADLGGAVLASEASRRRGSTARRLDGLGLLGAASGSAPRAAARAPARRRPPRGSPRRSRRISSISRLRSSHRAAVSRSSRWARSSASAVICSASRRARSSRPSAWERERAVISAADSCACLRIALGLLADLLEGALHDPLAGLGLLELRRSCARAPSGGRPPGRGRSRAGRSGSSAPPCHEDIRPQRVACSAIGTKTVARKIISTPDRHQGARLDHVADRAPPRSRGRRSR